MGRLLLALAASAALAGCLGTLLGGCPPRDTLEWHDPALYAALAAVEHEETPPPPGLFGAEALGAAGGVVTLVQWTPRLPGDEHGLALAQLAPGQLSAHARSDEEARRLLAAFLANASAASEEVRAALVEHALANRTEAVKMWDAQKGEPVVAAWGYAAAPLGAWRLEELARERNATPASHGTAGAARYDAGEHSFVVAHGARSATIEGVALTVDSAGRARALAAPREGGEDAAASVARVRAALEAAGLPAPQHPQVLTMVC